MWREGCTILGKENLNPFESASSSRKSRAWNEMITFWTREDLNSASQNPKNSALENSGLAEEIENLRMSEFQNLRELQEK